MHLYRIKLRRGYAANSGFYGKLKSTSLAKAQLYKIRDLVALSNRRAWKSSELAKVFAYERVPAKPIAPILTKTERLAAYKIKAQKKLLDAKLTMQNMRESYKSDRIYETRRIRSWRGRELERIAKQEAYVKTLERTVA